MSAKLESVLIVAFAFLWATLLTAGPSQGIGDSSRLVPAVGGIALGFDSPLDQVCEASTYCRGGYRIWCRETGNTCWADKGEGSWVWCAGYDEWGHSWESSDYCRH